MLSKRRMRMSLKKFLILSSLLFHVGCATEPKTTKFDAEWEFCEISPFEPPRACLKQKDVEKLRELLIRCEGSQ